MCDLNNGKCRVIFYHEENLFAFLVTSQEVVQSQSATPFWSIPVILGMPSSLGTGSVIIKPWAVPTHNSPWQIRRLVTRMLFWPAIQKTLTEILNWVFFATDCYRMTDNSKQKLGPLERITGESLLTTWYNFYRLLYLSESELWTSIDVIITRSSTKYAVFTFQSKHDKKIKNAFIVGYQC